MFTKLLVPLDGTPEAAVAVLPALTLARATGASMHLIRVSLAALGVPPLDEAVEAERGLERVAAELVTHGVAVSTAVRRGDAAEQIVAEARQRDADLIVMSTHALTGPARALLGSVADAVVRTSHRPVLLVRRDAPFVSAAGREQVGARAAT